jgi:hypothetical protein
MLKRIGSFIKWLAVLLFLAYLSIFVLERWPERQNEAEEERLTANEVSEATDRPEPTLAPATRTPIPTATEIPIRVVEIKTALKDGIVTLEAIGDGLETLDMILDSLSDEDLRIEVPPGTLFNPANGATQSMVVRRGELIDLPAGGQAQEKLEVGCASMHKGTPSSDDSFTLDLDISLTDLVDLLELVDYLEEDFRVQQFAIWTITDNPAPNYYVGLGYFGAGSGPDEEEMQAIYRLFLKAGIQTGKYRALAAFPTPTPAPTETLAPIDISDCILAGEITPAYVGQTVCMYGQVVYTYQGEGYTSLAFSKERGTLFLIAYDIDLRVNPVGSCVTTVGEVKELMGAPVIVTGFQNAPEACP